MLRDWWDGTSARYAARQWQTRISRSVATDLVQRRFAASTVAPEQVWVGDISYLRTWEGWAYVATVIDLHSRRVVGFSVASHMRASLVCEALKMALAQRPVAAGTIFHSDRGSQDTSGSFCQLLGERGLRQSLSRPRQCLGQCKTELVYRRALPIIAEARHAVFEYIEVFYNRKRIHSALGYRSPVDYEASTPPVLAASPAA